MSAFIKPHIQRVKSFTGVYYWDVNPVRNANGGFNQRVAPYFSIVRAQWFCDKLNGKGYK